MHTPMMKILQGSVVTQTVWDGLTICPAVANFLQYIRVKNMKVGCQYTKLLQY